MNVQMKTMKKAPRKTLIDLTGKTFHRLRVLSIGPLGASHRYWNCICKCGKKKIVLGAHMRRGRTKSCGCISRELATAKFLIHGESQRNNATAEYVAWSAMRRRCLSPSDPKFHRYGGRGITICKRWMRSYLAFLKDVGRKPTHKHTLGRINNNGNYEPGNVEWQTHKQQSRNTSSNRILKIRGESKSLAEWCEASGIKYATAHLRLKYGWPAEMAIDPSVRNRPIQMWRTSRGVRHPISRLTESQAMIAKHCPRTMKAYESLAKKFGVSVTCISSVRGGYSWKHLK